MDSELFGRFLHDAKKKMRDKSDSEKVRIFLDWCNRNNTEEVALRLSSEEKGGWSRNYTLDFTTTRIIVTKKSFASKFADLGYVAGLAPYPYLVLLKDQDTSKVRRQAAMNPDGLIKSTAFCYYVPYSDIEEFALKKGINTVVANMFGRAIVSNFLTVKTTAGKVYNFTLPVNKNGPYEQIHFWVSVILPAGCRPSYDYSHW
jgi:hypothetical protein